MKNKKRLKIITQFMKPYLPLFIIAEVCILISYAVSVLLPLNLTHLVDDVFYAKNYSLLKEVILIYILLFGISALFNLIYSFTWQTLNNRYIVDIKTQIYKTVMYAKAERLLTLNSGDIMNRMDNDAEQFIHIIQRNIFHFINSIIMCIGIIFIVAKINIMISVMLVVAAVIPIIFTKIFGRYVEKYTRELRDNNSRFTGKIFEILKGFREIILLGAQSFMRRSVFGILKKSILLENKNKKLDFYTNKTIYFINLITSVIIYAFSAWLIYQNKLTIGFFIAILEYVALLHKKINWIMRIYLDWHGRKVSIDRVYEILSMETELSENDREMSKVNEIESISFQDVRFAYPDQPLKCVIDTLSFEIKKGERAAIIGVSGIGKTTVTGLILKYFEPQAGRILINGKDLTEIDPFAIRQHIGIVQQEIILFNDSIRYNLSFGNTDNSDEELLRVCDKVGFLEFIKSLPEGLDTRISMASELSGGQKQRLMIARVLLRGVKTIIFDEATSALDGETEKSIIEEFNSLGKDITMIIISHRESTIKDCNKKIILKDNL